MHILKTQLVSMYHQLYFLPPLSCFHAHLLALSHISFHTSSNTKATQSHAAKPERHLNIYATYFMQQNTFNVSADMLWHKLHRMFTSKWRSPWRYKIWISPWGYKICRVVQCICTQNLITFEKENLLWMWVPDVVLYACCFNAAHTAVKK